MASSTSILAQIGFDLGDYALAQRLFKKSIDLHQSSGDKIGIAYASIFLGDVLYIQGNYPRAEACYPENFELTQKMGNPILMAWVSYHLGQVACAQHAWQEAQTRFTESLELRRKQGDMQGIAGCLAGFARLMYAQGDSESPARILGMADTLRQAADGVFSTIVSHIGIILEQTDYDRIVIAVWDAVGEKAFAEISAQGCSMTLDETIAYALDYTISK